MTKESTLRSKAIGPLPLINRFMDRLRLSHFIEEFVPCRDKRLKIAPSVGIALLLRNILISREPLYGLGEWAVRFEEQLLGLSAKDLGSLNDDRYGRCLDSLFEADRSALLTAVITHMVKEFDVEMDEFHNDSTSISVTGQYKASHGKPVMGRDTHRITFGHNKDHRPDLKQLLWILTTSADGAVPIWCSVDHGNATDDKTHIETWNTICRVVGATNFLYVADSKLCTKENMAHISQNHGRFITIIPKTRKEDSWFRDWIQTHEIQWTEVLRRKNSRRVDGPDEVYRGFESPMRSVEGYRIIWFWSSQKHELDRLARQDRIQKAIHGLEQLRTSINSPKSRLKSRSTIEAKSKAVLANARADRWLNVVVRSKEEHQYSQATTGRPSGKTIYIRKTKEKFELEWQSNTENLQYDDRIDGLFPLILNDDKLSLSDALSAYKRQPALEKRHEQMKTVLEVMPVNLKSNTRIEALFFIYFLALLVSSLVEREIRKNMKASNIASIPLYHEERDCKSPTANRIFEIFNDVRRHMLVANDLSVEKTYYDELTKTQLMVLKLLKVSSASYFAGDTT